MDIGGFWGFVLIILCIQTEVLFIWFLVKATKRVIKEIRVIREKGYKSANWFVLVFAFLFAVGFIGSAIGALLGNEY